jgi:VanZ family protein
MLAICLAAYGVLIELLQGLTVTRHPELLDLRADVAGILLGWILSIVGLRRWCVWLESGLESWRANQKR